VHSKVPIRYTRDFTRGTHNLTYSKYALHYADQATFFSDNRLESNRKLFEGVPQTLFMSAAI